MIKRSRKDHIDELCISQWILNEEEKPDYFYLEVPAICRIYSEVSAEECRKVLRAVVHTWMNYELAKNGIPNDDQELRKREKALLINRVPKASWEWGWALQKPANLYQLHEARAQHKAILCIMGNVWRFESKLKLSSY